MNAQHYKRQQRRVKSVDRTSIEGLTEQLQKRRWWADWAQRRGEVGMAAKHRAIAAKLEETLKRKSN